MSAIARKLEDWKRRLLDLTRRNPALFFRPEKPFNLQVEAPEADPLLARLLQEEKKRHVFIPPFIPMSSDQDETDLFVLVAQADNHSPTKPSADDVVFRVKDGKALTRRLRSLYRLSHADFEERALQTLYFAFGLLRWNDGGSEQCISPLLMVPVTLQRDPERDTYTIGPADEDPILNPSLTAKLAEAFQLKLPDVPDEWDNGTYEAWMDSITNAVSAYKWDVERSQWLARFSFHKLSLYQDLSSHAEAMAKHPIVAALAGDEYSVKWAEASATEIPDERQLDAKVSPHDSFTVLDADSSQLVCIEAVNRGHNVIVQGPPGTGKSQTIVNLIAQLIATGKTVLFVSEKIAALEVVYSRLKAVGLGRLCHELHSHKANKREVVNELHRSLTSSSAAAAKDSSGLDRLLARRLTLNEYADAIGSSYGKMRSPFFRYLGELALLHDVPHVQYGGDIKKIDDMVVHRALDLVRALERVWAVVSDGSAYPWFGLRIAESSLGFKSEIESEVVATIVALDRLNDEGQRLSEALMLAPPTSREAVSGLEKLASVLDDAPQVNPEWLSLDGSALKEQIMAWHRSFEELDEETKWLRASGIEEAVAKGTITIASWSRALEGLKSVCGSDAEVDEVLATLPENVLWIERLAGGIHDVAEASAKLTSKLQVQGIASLSEIQALVRVMETSVSGVHPDAEWFKGEVFVTLRDDITALRDDAICVGVMRREALKRYDESIFHLDIDGLIEKFNGEFRSLLRFFNGAYRSAIAKLRSARLDGKLPANITADLREIRECLKRDKEAAETHAVAIAALRGRYKKAATDFANVGQCVELVSSVRELVGEPSAELITALCGAEAPPRERALLGGVRAALDRLQLCLGDSSPLYKHGRLVNMLDVVDVCALPLVAASVASIRDAVVQLRGFIVGAFGETASNFSIARISELVQHVEQSRDLIGVTELALGSVRRQFGESYVSRDEPHWERLLRMAEWLVNRPIVLENMNSTIAQRLRGQSDKPLLLSQLRPMDQMFEEKLGRLLGRFAGRNGRAARELASGGLLETRAACELLLASLDRLQEWQDYTSVQERFRLEGLADLFQSLTALPTLDPAKLMDVAKKALLQAYVDEQLRINPTLREFRGDAHAQAIIDFRKLDKAAIASNSSRVAGLATQRRPNQLVAYQGSEARILLTEAGKKKKHLPIRKLFARMPRLLQQLKPCLLMSPLSVSQFLDPEAITFDCVIFDEASQICSEDAVSAIFRGKQLVICGDKKQLPPTSFFKEADGEDEFEESDDEVAVFESILAEAETAGFLQKQLTWHYRSAHESLIAFSNERFYNYSLITFPSRESGADETAVRFCHVPNGVYDRGGRRNNAIEADRVIGLILELIERWPELSLGVVAFSMPQAEAIQNRVDLLRKERPDLAWFFAEERLNGFFVKNLERVQGDERDHIMFSVGYGRDKNGILTMHFGPININGGEKRLNVAVTRARQQVTVVSSIRAADIDLVRVNKAGVLALHKYLDFAERGYCALDQNASRGDYESPFEEDVASVIRGLGYTVMPQVGVSSFRIDLGVLDPSEPGRFVLGVECDGATYHSSYTARDRDRLREEILVGKMGWVLHRIWSPDWIRQRSREIMHLQRAIETACLLKPIRLQIKRAAPSALASEPVVEDCLDSTRRIDIMDPWDNGAPSWTEPYTIAEISRARLTCEFHDRSATGCLTDMALEVICAEGPVHTDVVATRVARHWNLLKVGNRMVDAMEVVYQALVHGGKVEIRDGFCNLRGAAPREKVRRPVAGHSETFRSIHHISPEEIALGMRFLLQEAISFEQDQLVVQVARTLGYDRTGSTIKDRLVDVLEKLVEKKQMVREGDRILFVP